MSKSVKYNDSTGKYNDSTGKYNEFQKGTRKIQVQISRVKWLETSKDYLSIPKNEPIEIGIEKKQVNFTVCEN